MDSTNGRVVQGQICGTSFRLPSRIGFGLLDYKSIRQIYPEDQKWGPDLIAGYSSKEGDPVYQIRIGARSCQAEEYFEGEKIEATEGETIEEVFIRKFQCFKNNPRFLRIKERMAEGGRNISFMCPTGRLVSTASYPAGFVFVLRVPLLGRERMGQIKEDLVSLGSWMAHEVIIGGEIIAMNHRQTVHLRSDYVEFQVPLWQVEDAARLIFDTGLVDPGWPPEFGLHVLDLMSAHPGALNVSLRKEGEMEIAYTHWLNRPGDLDIARVEECLMTALFGRRGDLDSKTHPLN